MSTVLTLCEWSEVLAADVVRRVARRASLDADTKALAHTSYALDRLASEGQHPGVWTIVDARALAALWLAEHPAEVSA